MNFYPRYPGDYIRKTMHLSMVEDGAYTRLLDWYYSNEQPIPGDRRYAVARASTAAEKKAVDGVLAEFFTTIEGAHHSARADAEIEAAQKRIRTARDNGGKGGRKPKENPAANPLGSVQQTQGDYSPSPQRAKDSEANASGGEPPDAAELIWGLGVPLLVSAGLAEKAARSMLGLLRKGHPDALIVEALHGCAEQRPLDPIAFLQGRLRAKPKTGETTFQRSRREQAEKWGGGLAAVKAPTQNVIDMEATDATLVRLG